MQAVRGSDGTGSTVYQNTSKRPLETGVGFSEPLLAPSPTKKPAATANTRALRPWKRHNGDAEHPVNTEADGSHQLPTPVPSDPPVQAKRRSDKERGVDRSDSDDEFGALDDHGEADLVHLTKAAEQSNPDKRTREWKENMKAVEEFEDHGGALFDEAERMLLDKLKPNKAGPKPVVRKFFPTPILDRSPIFGASNNTTLRVCFRVGEALNVGCQAVRLNKDVVLELYARVTASWREPKPSHKQHFVIKDLYHDKPPHLNGTFELWNQSKLWETDSLPFLFRRSEGTMCRMIARMRRDGTKWRLEVMNVWQASWEDVEHVAGLYARRPVDEEV